MRPPQSEAATAANRKLRWHSSSAGMDQWLLGRRSSEGRAVHQIDCFQLLVRPSTHPVEVGCLPKGREEKETIAYLNSLTSWLRLYAECDGKIPHYTFRLLRALQFLTGSTLNRGRGARD